MATLQHWNPILEDVKLEQTRASSTMFSMLPSSLQSRLPPLPLRSVRKSVSMQTLKTTTTTTAASSRPSSHGHGPTRSLSGIDAVPLSPSPRLLTDGGGVHEKQITIVTPERSPPPEYPTTPTIEEPVKPISLSPPSSIQWRYAQQGLSLISVAQDEVRQPLARPGPDFERKAFLDGVEYIMKALPHDLSDQEMDRLRISMPVGFAPPSPEPASRASGRDYAQMGGQTGKNQDRSLLHRLVQMVVVYVFLVMQMALPYVMLLLRAAARTEREYKISETVFGAGLGLANFLGSKGITVTGTIYNLGDGRVGQALSELFAWAVEGFTGGLTEGVGEGLSMVGTKRQGKMA